MGDPARCRCRVLPGWRLSHGRTAKRIGGRGDPRLVARSRPTAPLVFIVALAIILVVALVFGVRYLLHEPRAPWSPEADLPDLPDTSTQTIDRVRKAVGAEGILASHINRYQVRLGRWPSSLDDLIRCPPDLKPGEVWDGPYIHAKRLLIDPWGNHYRYRAPGRHNTASYDLWSVGPDGRDGSGDEIGNWTRGPATPAEENATPEP